MRVLLEGSDKDPFKLAAARLAFGQWPLPNVHLGVSVEDQRWAEDRIPDLLETPAAVRFVSYEPALGPIEPKTFGGVDWIIVGGESGPGARPFDPEWALRVVEHFRGSRTKVFVKQLGSNVLRWARLDDPKGGDPAEWPAELRVRQFPGDYPALPEGSTDG
jgi:protein gp37